MDDMDMFEKAEVTVKLGPSRYVLAIIIASSLMVIAFGILSICNNFTSFHT